MIVVVEGPSAAGKTTWIGRHCDPGTVVPEPGVEEIRAAPRREGYSVDAARYWVEVHAERWALARRIEARAGIAVCDGDPCHLHYVWSLWRTGHATDRAWHADVDAHRTAFREERIGLADLILVTVPDHDTLERHRRRDALRPRRHFELHAQLAGPLTEWYQAIEALDAQRVRWELPLDGIRRRVRRRDPRSGPVLFERLLDVVPRT